MSDIKTKAIRELQLEEDLGKYSVALLLDLIMLEFTGWLPAFCISLFKTANPLLLGGFFWKERGCRGLKIHQILNKMIIFPSLKKINGCKS